MPEPVIQIKKLSKKYQNNFQALDNINLNINKGEIFALLGPNGAGKTTLINIISGLTIKSSGDVSVFGKDVELDYKFTRSKIGLVSQEITVEIFVTVFDTVQLQAGYFGLADGKKRAEQILKQLSLWDKRKSYAITLSGGMKRRVMIAKAMVHNPDILFMDEPTAGVDIELRAQLWKMIEDLKNQGKTIILTTHYLEEAERLADRIGLINNGRLIAVDSKQKLIDRFPGENLNQIYTRLIKADKNSNS